MREHMGLYRGKRIDNGEWVEGSLLKVSLNGKTAYLIFGDNFSFVGNDVKALSHALVDPDTVGECTGLKDKNGKLIFEGYICRNTKTGEVVSVHWHGTMAGFVWSKRKEKSHIFDFGEMFRAHDKYEVIGNVVDNPELLKGGEGE